MPLSPASDSLIVEQGFILQPTAEPILQTLGDGFLMLTAPSRNPQLYLYDSQSQLIAQVDLIGGDVDSSMFIAGLDVVETNNGFMVAFQAQVGTNGFTPQMVRYVRHFDADGTALGDPVALTEPHDFGTPIATTIGTRADGGTYAVYINETVFDPSNIYQAFDADGKPVGDPITLGPTSQTRSALESGGFVISDFASDSADAELIFFGEDGVETMRSTLTGTLNAHIVEVQSIPNGGYAVFLDDSDVHSVRFVDATGAPTGAAIQLVDYNSALQDNFEIEFLPDGRFVMIGSIPDEDGRFAADNEILAYLFDANGIQIGEPLVVAEHDNESEALPEIIELADGRIAVGYFSIDQFAVQNSYRIRIFNVEDDDQGPNTIDGTDQAETLNGTDGTDIILGLEGDDTLFGDPVRALLPDSFEAQVYRAYVAVLEREPDLAGLEAYLDAMRLDILDQGGIVAEFVGSDEFQASYGNLDNEAFVQQLYRNVFNREADSAGLEAYRSALDSGELTRAEVVLELANSAEFLQLTTQGSGAFGSSVALDPAEGAVYRLYQAVFDRAPDLGGFTAYVNGVQAGTIDFLAIAVEFVASAEFQATYGALSNADFVELLYANVLPSNDDQAGRASYTASLDAGTLTRTEMVLEFAQSFEFIQATENGARDFRDSIFTDNEDRLDGGAGNDTLFGGRGEDVFLFDVTTGDQDTILDFTIGSDRIELGNAGTAFDTFDEIVAAATQDGNDTLIDFGDGNTLRLENVRLRDLTAEDFGLTAASSAEKSGDTDTLIYEREEMNTDLLIDDLSAPLEGDANSAQSRAELHMDLWLTQQALDPDAQSLFAQTIDDMMEDALI